jgi:hypothetical protein
MLDVEATSTHFYLNVLQFTYVAPNISLAEANATI